MRREAAARPRQFSKIETADGQLRIHYALSDRSANCEIASPRLSYSVPGVRAARRNIKNFSARATANETA